jgi:ribosome-associated toxin RatA of RatAB toxin-antitoxin module
MITIERSALVPYSADQMYALVDDVTQYPQFMHGCIAAEVVSRTPEELIRKLTLGKAGLRYSFTTRNLLTAGVRMDMTLVEGPFRSFSATWHFKALTPEASKVSLVMHFEWAGGLLGAAMEKLFQHSANSLVDEVVNRAQKVYGVK